MSSKRHLNKGRLIFWFLFIAALWHIACATTGELDRRIFTLAAKATGITPAGKTLHLLRPGETAPPEPDTIQETKSLVTPIVGMVSLGDKQVQDCFAALPLGPQDMAVLLSNLSSGGIRTIGISSPMTWQEPPAAIAQQMICLSLSLFRNAAIGLRGRTASQADFTPTVLRQHVIPAAQVEGDTTGLPSANKAMPNDLLYATEALRLAWAPDWIDEEPLTQKASSAADRSYPLLARWNGEIMPTLPLCLALAETGRSVSDIHARIGRDIRIGTLAFPLDEHGRTKLKQFKTAEIRLEDVVRGTGESLKQLDGSGLAIMEQPGSGQEAAGRLELLAATLSQLCAKEKTEHSSIPGAPGQSLQLRDLQGGWIRSAIALLCLFLALRCLPVMPGFLRKAIMLSLLCYLLWQARQGLLGGYWFQLSACLIVWLSLLPALRFLTPVERGIFSSRRR